MAYNELGVMILGGDLAGDVIDAPAEVDGTRDGSGWDAARKPHAINICSLGKDENLYTAKYNPDTEATGLKSAGSSVLTDMSVLLRRI